MPTHHLDRSARSVAVVPVVTSVSTPDPSTFARMTRIPSRSPQYSLPPARSRRSCFGVYVPAFGTMVTTFDPSRFERITEPSSSAGTPMLVQKMWPPATSTARPSGPWPADGTSVRGIGFSAAAVNTFPPTSR